MHQCSAFLNYQREKNFNNDKQCNIIIYIEEINKKIILTHATNAPPQQALIHLVCFIATYPKRKQKELGKALFHTAFNFTDAMLRYIICFLYSSFSLFDKVRHVIFFLLCGIVTMLIIGSYAHISNFIMQRSYKK